MKLVVMILVTLVATGASAQEKQDPDREVLSAVLNAADSYLTPSDEETGAALVFSGSVSLASGVILFAEKLRVSKGIGVGSSLVGTASVGFGLRAMASDHGRKKNAHLKEKAFLESKFYVQLKARIGESKAREFYQDLRAGVGIHRLVKAYSPNQISMTYLAFFREERDRVGELIPESALERQQRLDLIDVIAGRRAAFRLVALEAGPEERTRIEETLERDLEEIRMASARSFPPAGPNGGQGPDSGPPPASTHD